MPAPKQVHTKNNHRMGRNYLKEKQGDGLNVKITAIGFQLPPYPVVVE